MKKKLGTIFGAVALIIVMLFAFCACSSYGGIKGNYEKAGYKEIETNEDYKKEAQAFFGEDADLDKATIHVLKKEAEEGAGVLGQLAAAASIVIIVEFKSDDELVSSLKDKYGKENVENAYDELQKLDTVNGNCVLALCTNPLDIKLFKS